jgi:sugar lactone lactonase YvrE
VRIARRQPVAALHRDIVLPVSQPTMCAFAGEALDVMYVTSATDKLTPKQLQREPLAGSLLRLRPGVTGIPRPCMLR